MEEKKAKEIIENYIKAYNHFDIKGMLKDLHEEVTFQNISGGEINLITHGIEEFKQQAEQAKQFFMEREQTIRSIRFNEDTAEAEIRYTGVLATDFPGGLKPGDTLNVQGKSVFTFQNYKIIEITDIS